MEAGYVEGSYRHGERHVRERLSERLRLGEFFGHGERPLGERDDEEPLGYRDIAERGDQYGRNRLRIRPSRDDERTYHDREESREVGESSVTFEISHKASEHLFVRKSADADGQVDDGEYLQNGCVAHNGKR